MRGDDEAYSPSRRTFLRDLAALGLGTSVMGGCARAISVAGAPVRATAIGLQLYTVRDLLEKDFEGTLARVAQIGYSRVEFAGYYGRTPEQVRAIIDRLGVSSPSAHVGASLLRQDAAAQIRSAKVLGQEYITLPSYSFARGGGIDTWKQAATEFNRWGALCRDAGLRLAFHNHSVEFTKVDGGPTGFDVLMRETDSALVDFELDLYWAVFADQSPLALLAKYPGRITMWHVKDMQVVGGTRSMAAVGSGTLDFTAMFARARESGLKHFFVEHDNAAATGGSLQTIEAGYAHLRRILT